MPEFEDYPSGISTNPNFPYFIQDESAEPTSYVTVKLAESYEDTEADYLFYIAGGSLVNRDRGTTTAGGSIHLVHSFARDDENDRASVVVLELKSIIVTNMYENEIQATAWLTEMRFYPDGFEDGVHEPYNPFTGAVKNDTDEDHYANSGYPYIPPVVEFNNSLKLPEQVLISLKYNRDNVSERFVRIAERVAETKRERAEKAEKLRIEREEKQARQKREHEAWLLTDEGKVYKFERDILNEIKTTIAAGNEFTEEELQILKEEGRERAESIHSRFLSIAKEAVTSRRGNFRSENTGRNAFLAGFDERILERS